MSLLHADTPLALERLPFGEGPARRPPAPEPPPAASPAETLAALGSFGEPSGPEQAFATVARELANSVAHAIVTAVRGLENHRSAEIEAFQESARRQEDRLQQAVDSLGSAARERLEELAGHTASLRQSHQQQEARLAELGQQAGDLSGALSGRLDGIENRVEAQQKELSSLRSTVGELAPKLTGATERLERQAGALRSLYEVQERRKLALDHLGEVLAKLKVSLSAPILIPMEGL